MKIVHVLPALTKGGGERVAAELASRAAEQGHEVTVLAGYPVDPGFLQNDLHPGVRVKFVSETKKGLYVATLRWIGQNKAWLSAQDILHCHLTYGALFGTLVFLLRKGKNGPRVVETYHAVGMPIPAVHRWLHTRFAEKRDALVLMAEDAYWKRFTGTHPKLVTQFIANGVSITWPQATPTEKDACKKALGIPPDCRFVVGTVGMLRPDRQPWRYIPIFGEVAKAIGPGVHFVIAGAGPEEEKIKTLIAEHNLTYCVHLMGLVQTPALPFSIIDLYVSLSVGPTTGVSMFEAALCGLPVVAIQVTEGYQAKPTDWVWSSTDDKEVAQRIIHLLLAPEDRKTLAERQKAYVKNNHTTEVMAAAYDELYRRLHSSSIALPISE